MDPMRALASLDFISARGLDTPDQGPHILADQFGKKMMKILKKRNDFIQDMNRNRGKMRREDALSLAMAESTKLWSDTCSAHEAYQFLRWQNLYFSVNMIFLGKNGIIGLH